MGGLNVNNRQNDGSEPIGVMLNHRFVVRSPPAMTLCESCIAGWVELVSSWLSGKA